MAPSIQLAQKNNRNIIIHFKGQEEFVSRMLDMLEKAERYRKVFFTPFLNENELDIIKRLPTHCFIYEDGAYDKAERKRVAISFYEEEIEIPVIIMHATYDEKFIKLTHRDVLGSLMGLGIEREVIGDILVGDGHIYIVISEEMENYIHYSLTQIKHANVNFERTEEIIEIEDKKVYVEATIASMRLDAVVAAITNLSREKSQNLIRGGRVKVNQVVLEECDFLCNNNSTVSIQRYGRFSVEDTKRTTRKGRHVIRIGKYV